MTNFKLFVILSVLILGSWASSSNYATINPENLKRIFDSVKPYTDLSNTFYSVRGLNLLGETLSAQSQTEICNFVKSKVDKNSVESIYYSVSLAALIPNCGLPTTEFQATLNNAASGINVPDLYYYTLTSQLLKTAVDAKKVAKNVLDGLKKDSSILNQGYSLHIASLLSEGQKQFFDTIEDILEQADEVDKKYLQYEGGVGTTSIVLEGIFELSSKLKQFPAKFDQQRLTKFVNYLSSKRQPTNIKSAYFLLRACQKLSDNQFNVPMVLNRISQINVSPAQPNVVVSLTNILGKPIKQAQFTIEAESAKSQKANGATLLSAKRPFTAKSSDGTTFELKLVDQAQPAADFYFVTVSFTAKSSTPNDNVKRFFLVQNRFEVKVTTLISLQDVNIGAADRDQTQPRLVKVDENTQLKDKLEADQHSKFYLKFTIKEKSKNSLVEAHQTFVRFSDLKSGREIIFLAQATTNKQYSAEVDFGANAKNFRHNSGVYSIELFVSDPLVENPIKWKLGEIKLQFLEDPSTAASLDKATLYAKKPEIKHLFRPPEQTPPVIVSTVFTALCLIPFGLLLIIWLRIGVNFSKFQFSVWSLLFHGSLGAIFVLYYFYWTKFNMFETLKYLTLIGGVALVSGQKLLRSLASKEKSN